MNPLRWFVGVVVGMGLVAILAKAHSSEQSPPEVIVAQSFEVRDKDGRLRSKIGVNPDGVTFVKLLTKDGKDRAEISVNSAGDPRITLTNSSEIPCAMIDVDSKSQLTTLELTSGKGGEISLNTNRNRFMARMDGSPDKRIVLYSGSGTEPTIIIQKGKKSRTISP